MDDERFPSRAVAEAVVGGCIERFYNLQWRHSHLDCTGPVECESKAQLAALAACQTVHKTGRIDFRLRGGSRNFGPRMRSHAPVRPSASLVAGLLLASCAPSRAPSRAEARAPGPASRKPEPTGAAPKLASDATGSCRLRLGTPSGRSAMANEALAAAGPPLLAALCACPLPAAGARLVVRVLPERGEVQVEAPDADDGDALETCLAPRLGSGVFAPYRLGSDCIDCGPRRYGVLRGGSVPTPGAPAAVVVLPLEIRP